MKILLIEDYKVILETLAELMSGEFQVLKASNAEDAYDLLLREAPDCIVCDIIMPGISGIEFLKRIRDEGHELPVIIMTGYSSQEYAEQCANLRTSGYVKKPVEAALLIDLVKRATGTVRDKESTPRLTPVLLKVREWIRENLSSSFTLADAAKANGISVSHLSRLYKDHLGISFTDDVNRVRIERAKQLLDSTDDPIDTIRQVVGYVTAQHFYTKFKKITGKTPREYRLSQESS